MTQSLQRVLAIALLSHALAFTTFFSILSGMLDEGTQYIPPFLLVALVLAVYAFLQRREVTHVLRQRMLVGGIVLTLLGIGSLFFLDERPMYPVIFFGPLSFLLTMRLTQVLLDVAYLRNSLLEYYRFDLICMIAASVLTVIMESDPAWQTKMMPFFIAFFCSRLYALSAASRLARGVQKRGGTLERLQISVPMLLTGVSLLLMWGLQQAGGPVADLISTIISPVFYAIGWVVQGLSGLITDSARERIGDAVDSMGKQPIQSFADEEAVITGQHFLTENLLYVVMLLLAVICLYIFYQQKKRMERARLSKGVVEVREFIHRERKAEAQPRMVQEPGQMTKMRRLYRRFLHAMRKQGHTRGEGQTALEYIDQIGAAHPELADSMQELTDTYMQERYGNRSVDKRLSRAEQLTERMERNE